MWRQLAITASHGAMRADVQGFCKFKVASRIDIFILQKSKKHISLKKRFGRQCFISRTAQACQTLGATLRQLYINLMTIKIILFYFILALLTGTYIWLGTKWRWIYLVAIISTFAIPGLLKLFDHHMVPDIAVECKKMCDLTPVETLFYFFGYSRMFIRTAGFIQLISGLLLFSKKYRLLGLMCCFILNSFINLLNISFWGMSLVTIYMLMITASIIVYMYLDYKDNLKGLVNNTIDKKSST